MDRNRRATGKGGLPFTYHVGPGPTRVHMRLKLNYAYRTIWDVIGIIPGKDFPNEAVIGGNHRDAWVYGAVDPSSGTAAMLETVHGLGELLKTGWRPKRTIILGSWDAEEQGLIGSTEWVEDQEKKLAGAAVYFNMDTAVSGPLFAASAVPSLKQFMRDVTKAVPSPGGGSVYDAWLKAKQNPSNNDTVKSKLPERADRRPAGRGPGKRIGFHSLPTTYRRSRNRHQLQRPLRRLPLRF